MNLAAMVTRVSERLNEGATGPVSYPGSEIVAALNEANRFFCLLTLALETTQPWSLDAATTFYHMLTVFPDWLVCLRMTDAAGRKVRPARIEDLTALDAGWRSAAGDPVRYCSLGADLVAIYRQPADLGTTLQVTYARAPLVMAADVDVPEIPVEHHQDLVDYGIYRVRQVEGGQEFQKALTCLDRFFKGAEHYAAYVRARNLGSRYDKTPFELERFDRSGMLKLRADLVPARKGG
jgi:hypothetical protein